MGLSLEKFDAVGRRRSAESGVAIDASGGFPDGSRFADVQGLEAALLRRPELFVGTVAEKLLTYASGRGLEYYDAPAIRTIVRDARAKNFRMSSDHSRSRPQPAIPDEDVAMIITRKALPRRTFLRGIGRDRGAAAARRHGPVDDRARPHGGRTGAAARLHLHADGLRPGAVDARRATASCWSCRHRCNRWRRSSIS